jgi:hypothetical protein
MRCNHAVQSSGVINSVKSSGVIKRCVIKWCNQAVKSSDVVVKQRVIKQRDEQTVEQQCFKRIRGALKQHPCSS